MSETYTCAKCGETFTCGWSDAEAEAEYRANFPELADRPVDGANVCDDCYQQFMAWFEKQPPAQKEAMNAGRGEAKFTDLHFGYRGYWDDECDALTLVHDHPEMPHQIIGIETVVAIMNMIFAKTPWDRLQFGRCRRNLWPEEMPPLASMIRKEDYNG